jgi:hypothetical protein
MQNLDLRLRKLETRGPTAAKEVTDDPSVVAAWTAKLDARLEVIHAEASRREPLPLDEQLRLLKTDHGQEIVQRAGGRAIGTPHDAGLEAFADRLHEITVRCLEQRIREDALSSRKLVDD